MENDLKNRGDSLIRALLYDGQASVMLCRSTALVEKARETHDLSPLCTAALGRVLTMTAMLGAGLKGGADDSVTVTFAGNGPAGRVVAVGREGGIVKGYIDEPRLELPLRADGKLDVGGAIGSSGKLTVVRDMGLGEPYVGQVNLVSGEVADDFAMYFTASEQQPSLVALGVRVRATGVAAAGGIRLSPLPGCGEEALAQMEARSKDLGNISKLLEDFDGTNEELLNVLFPDAGVEVLESCEPKYECGCSRERMERALISLGKEELTTLIEEDGQVELTCQFCGKKHHFDREALNALLCAAQ